MYRLLRASLLIAGAYLLNVGGIANAADYTLDTQSTIASALPAPDEPRTNYDAFEPAIAIGRDFHMLVVWSADDGATVADSGDDDTVIQLADGEYEIFGNITSTRTVGSIQGKRRISVMGSDSETDADERSRYSARKPAAAWNPVADEFLVVWEGDDDTAPLVDDEFEIFAQRVRHDGRPVGDRIRISVTGDDAESDTSERQRYGAHRPAIAVDTTTGNYLVVWQADDNEQLVDDEFEIFGRILNADAEPEGEPFRISTTGDDTQPAADRARYDASQPAVVFNPVSGNFVVAWQADDHRDGMVDGEHEIFLQQVDGAGVLVSTPVRASQMGPDGDAGFDALAPALAVEPETGTLLVSWHGDTLTSVLVEDELEVHGRLFASDLVALDNAFRISATGPDAETDPAERARFEATDPAVSWNPQENRFLVIWRGDTSNSTNVDNEFEIFGRFVALDGSRPLATFRVSTQGDNKEDDADERRKFAAENPVLGYDSSTYLAVWSGDTNLSGGTNNYQQIFGTRIATTYTRLEMTRPPHPRIPDAYEDVVIPTVPDPIKARYILTNAGDVTAENVVVRAFMSNEFPLTWIDCPQVSADNECEFGDLEAGEKVEFSVELATEQLELGDPQSAELTVGAYSDTALEASAASATGVFVGASLVIEGGRGSADWTWLLILGGLPLLARRRQRR